MRAKRLGKSMRKRRIGVSSEAYGKYNNRKNINMRKVTNLLIAGVNQR
jgi:hypothetical protein